MGLIPDLTTTFDDGEGLQVSTDASSLDFLQAVYRNPEVQLPVRMRAAGMALPFESPKLAVVATINGGDFAGQLDKAIERSSRVMKTIDHQPTQPPSTAALSSSEPMTSNGHKPSVPDRRYRRW